MKVYSIKGSNRTEDVEMDDHGKKIQEQSGVDMTPSDSNCNGSLRCPNPNCSFILKFEERNRLKVNSSRICELCGALGEDVVCPARQYTGYISEKKVRIFHFGTHTCKTKFVNNRPIDLAAAAISVNPKIKPSQIQGNAILTAIRKGKSWNEVEKVAKQVTDKQAISNEKIKQRQQALTYGEDMKLYTDEKDLLLIYSVNENEQIVFKTSHSKMLVANEMVRDVQHLLSNEYCFFDGKVKRYKNFLTLTASVYHPVLKKQLPLATMECKSED